MNQSIHELDPRKLHAALRDYLGGLHLPLATAELSQDEYTVERKWLDEHLVEDASERGEELSPAFAKRICAGLEQGLLLEGRIEAHPERLVYVESVIEETEL